MAFVDELTFHARAGKGGNGVVRWLHMKFKEFGGPSGGDGGRGGDVYARAVRDVHLLSEYRSRKEFVAQSGDDGQEKSRHGKNGDDLYIKLPIGSIITNLNTKRVYTLETEGQEVLLLKGGNGGRGNESFKGSTNRAPDHATEGLSGEESDFHVELQLIADIGLIGLPNAGKSTLLNMFTRANSKVGAYPFTTLEPHLGECFGYVIADIPGLIEGAADGKGLGHTFLRHVRRTKLLVHLVSAEHEDVCAEYTTIRGELNRFDESLAHKKEIVVLTKTDVSDSLEITQKKLRELKECAGEVYAVSAYDDVSLKQLLDVLLKASASSLDQVQSDGE